MDLRNTLAAVFAGVGLLWPAPTSGDPVTVRYREGVVHGLLTLRSPDGAVPRRRVHSPSATPGDVDQLQSTIHHATPFRFQ
jgi:hypothetical protein